MSALRARRWRRWRRLNRLYAYVAGYFWKRCPNCHRMFGGHECGGTLWLHGDDRSREGKLCCWQCAGDYYAFGYGGYRSSSDRADRSVVGAPTALRAAVPAAPDGKETRG